MPITISGSTGIAGVDGTASSPAIQGADTNTGVFYPAADQVAIATGGVQRLLVDASGNATLTGTLQVGGVAAAMYPLVLGTAVASTSGTSIDFTGIPSWVRRITVMFNGVSTNGISPVIVQLGTGATPTYTTSGYQSFGIYNGGTTNITNGLTTIGIGASDTRWGSMILSTSGSNSWTEIVGNAVGTNGGAGGGGITLGAALTAIRITTSNGTDTFDAGSINILYE
jgi:hypothetical protein